MLGTALQFGSDRGEDRFYIPAKARKNLYQRKLAQKAKKGDSESVDSTSNSKVVAYDNTNSDKLSHSFTKHLSAQPANNIHRFLQFTTPLVPAQYLSKTTMRGWKTCDVEYQSYFTLNNLWESIKEWSTYGAGVPLLLNQSESVVQYYVPYLSAIQLYGQSAEKSNAKSRYTGGDSNGDYYRDSSCAGNIDYEFGNELSTSQSSEYLAGDVSFQMSRLSIHNKHNVRQEGFSSDEDGTRNPQDLLLFEYFEKDLPYSREPLTDKIIYLAGQYPGLKSLRSCDLLPDSWMSVAWYPIYRIPTGRTLKDLDACFLTYHTFHMPLTGSGGDRAPTLVYPSEVDGVPKICLPTFAMASYKLKGSMWIQNGVGENQLADSLLQAADNWLKLLQVNHPDYEFFTSHGTYHR